MIPVAARDQSSPALFSTCSLPALCRKIPARSSSSLEPARGFLSPPFSLESSQIKMAVIQSQESLPLLWK